jgi:hypothetical protein
MKALRRLVVTTSPGGSNSKQDVDSESAFSAIIEIESWERRERRGRLWTVESKL